MSFPSVSDEVYPPYFIHMPAAMILSGASQSGKSYFVANLLLNAKSKLENKPSHVLYCYNSVGEQELYNLLRKRGVVDEWHEGWPQYQMLADLAREHKDSGGLLCVLDDLGSEVVSQDLTRIFTVLSHHQNTTVMLVLHNFFMEGKDLLTGTRSTTHTVLFGTRRDPDQISSISKKLRPSGFRHAGPKFIENCYYDSMESFGRGAHLILDTHPRQRKEYSVIANLFEEGNKPIACYQPAGQKPYSGR